MELEPSQGDRLAISKWQTKTNLHLVCAGYTASALKGKAGLNRYEGLPWVRGHAANPHTARRGNGIVHEFIAHEFTKKVAESERWNYKISAAISELIINAPSFGIGTAPAWNWLESCIHQRPTRQTQTTWRCAARQQTAISNLSGFNLSRSLKRRLAQRTPCEALTIPTVFLKPVRLIGKVRSRRNSSREPTTPQGIAKTRLRS